MHDLEHKEDVLMFLKLNLSGEKSILDNHRGIAGISLKLNALRKTEHAGFPAGS